MVFDVHHHLVRERLESYEDPSIAHYITLAAQTWPQPEWQIVHLSNGRSSLHDRAHHDYVQTVPSSFYSVPWIELEAKLKEQAIAALREQWAALFTPPLSSPVHSPTLGGVNALE
jgi:UV DNA damage endonuclease